MDIIFYILLGYMVIISLVGLVMMAVDKIKATQNAWRISEACLLTIAVAGGGAGIWLGMQLFRHKTKHPKFYIGIPVLLAVHAWLLVMLHKP